MSVDSGQLATTTWPLSYGQQSMWYTHQLDPESAAYNTAFAARICSQVDVPALRATWQTLLDRHGSLRTTFRVRGGTPIQEVHESQEIDFAQVDASAWSDAELTQRVRQAHVRPFDLEQGPVCRVRLFTRGRSNHVLLFTAHHIAIDAWSQWRLLRELRDVYPELCAQQTAVFDSPAGSYDEYVAWQAETLKAKGGRLWSFWKNQLSGDLPLLNLPSDRSRPPVQSFNGAAERICLPPELCASLRQLSSQTGTTPYALLLAAYQVLLHRHSRQDDILVGSPTAGRMRPQFAATVGNFVDMMVLRGDLSGNPSFRSYLDQVRKTVTQALLHQDFPFRLVVERLHSRREASAPPIFQAEFVWDKPPQDLARLLTADADDVVEWGGLQLAPFEMSQQEGQFDLSLLLIDGGDTIGGSLNYNTDLFDAGTVRRMAGHFQTLLEAIVADPGQRIDDLPLLNQAERRHLLIDLNATQSPYPADKCMHEVFESQAAQTPHAVAVTDGRRSLTYEEVNARANQLAACLQEQGVGTEAAVGVCLERSVETLISLLAIFKAGGAYLPLEPKLPTDRLRFMLDDAAVQVVLTTSDCSANLLAEPARVVDLDTAWENISRHSAANPPRATSPPNLAYIIYTSGSTGLPKGAMVTHQGMMNHLYAKVGDLDLHADDRIAQTAPQSFDISIWQFLSGALVGGSVHIVDADTVRSPSELLDLVEREQISILEVVPSLFRVLLDELSARGAARPEFAALRWLLLTGEALPPVPCNEWFPLYPSIPLMNAYGPTECSDDVTHHVITGRLPADATTVPIGRAVANTQLYILDGQMQPTPIGVPGELYVGGDGVGRGYVANASRTAAAFVPSPFGSLPGARLYKTGDLARYRADGTIEFLGRLDYQVKVRGFRIELGEIETLLAQHDAVRESLVIAHESANGQTMLAAYVVPQVELPPSAADLRQHLSGQLPDYMVPAAFVFLDEFPLTANGKIDRKALPAPEAFIEAARQYAPPRNELEEQLCGIWQQVLYRDRVGVEDNFFELGGDSILGIKIVSQASEQGIRLTARQLFEHQTISELAPVAETTAEVPAESEFIGDEVPFALSGLSESQLDRLLATEPFRQKSIEDVYPLSPMQQGVLFHTLREPDSGMYCEQVVLWLEGPLDVDAFQHAWRQLQQRHAVLRTTFVWQGVPHMLQVVHRQQELPWAFADWRDRTAQQQQQDLDRTVASSRTAGFDVERGPLWRVELKRLDDASWVCMFASHHALGDGWSFPLMWEEVIEAYRAECGGRELSLPKPRPYRDFIVWQVRQDKAAAEAYWRRELQGLSAATPLPVDRLTAETQPGTERLDFQLSKAGCLQLRQFGRQHRLTLNTLMQGAWAILLSRYSGEDDVIFGATTSGRPAELPGVNSMIGMFINGLPVRVQIPAEQPVAAWLGQLQDQQVASRQYEHCSLIDIQRWSDVPAGSPLFESLMVFDNYLLEEQLCTTHADGLQVRRAETREQTNYPLTISVCPGEAFGFAIHYDRARFNRATIERLAGHLTTLLEGIVSQPACPLSELPLLTDAERQQLLVDWNNTAAEYPQGKCIHELFEAQVERTPDAVAIVCEDQQLTYGELNARANQLAHYLRGLGVGPEVLVGVFMERSLEMVISLYGILKAGGAYVPLDPTYPRERLEQMVEDARIPVLLTQQALHQQAPSSNAQIICLDTNWAEIGQHLSTNPLVDASCDQAMYVIYTSGSTGRPKGVLNEHRGLANRLHWMQKAFGLTSQDRVLQKTPFSFDVSVWEFFWPLLEGAVLVVARPEGHKDGVYLAELIHAQQITTLHFVPSMLQAFLEVADLDLCSCLRRVICSGEALPHDLVQRCFSRLPHVEIHNLYGPTEAAVDVSWWVCQPNDATGIVPIGKPIDNTQLHVLDPHLKLVPVGVAGELHIGGVQVARGYLNRPELTAAKFIRDPFANDPDSRLYKTGDLCRWLPDGNIEFLGRIDHQVKIRGFRIELGEIESVLSTHPQVGEALVMAREDEPNGKRLVAYLVAAEKVWDASAPSVRELREYLSQSLPDYMVPSAFVFLDSLPLTPNGKVDRKALPAPEGRGELGPQYLPPRNPVQEQLCDIWQQVLRVDRVGIEDNFFELGGHSLLATQVVSRVRGAFQVELAIAEMFSRPTVAELAESVQSQLQGGQAVRTPPLVAQPRENKVALSFAQQRLWFLDQLLPDSPLYNVPAAMRLRGALDRGALEQTLAEIVRRHEALRTRFESVDGEPRQVIESEWPGPWVEYEDLRILPDGRRQAEAISRAQAEAARAFDLTRGPLLRVCLWQLADDEHLLLVNMHHIVSDGWSMDVLRRELSALYNAYTQSRRSPLPELPVQYADYASWQRNWLQGDVLDQQVKYWRQRLAGAEVLDLRTDHPRPAVPQAQGGEVSFELPQELSERLEQLCGQQEVSLFMLLLSAWQVLLSRYTGQDDIVVGTPIANRTRAETEGLIGFFVNTLALRSDLSGDPRFVDVLSQVRDRSLEAYAHQDLPFEQLVDALEVERDLSRQSLAQVGFGWHHANASSLNLGELAVEPVELKLTTAKTDLILFMGETEQGLAGCLEYRTDLFERGTIERIAENLTTLLERIAAAPERRLSQFSLLTEREGVCPVSFSQEANWYTHQLAPTSAAFNDAVTLRIRSPLDVAALRRACGVLAIRHPVLRTVFPIVNGEPVQSVQQVQEVPLEMIDAREWTLDETRRQVTLAYQRPFDLERGPIWRVSLFTRADDDHVLLVTIHEIACDAWSCGIVLQELHELYSAEAQGLPAPALPPAAPYADYTRWQRDMLASDKGERLRAYWHAQISAALEDSNGLELPTDRPLPSMQTRRGASHSFHVESELLGRLEALAEAEGTTLFVTLLAAYQVMLARYTGQTQIPIAVPMNGRSRRDHHNTLGNVMNSVIINADASGQPSFTEFLTQVQRAVRGGLLNQEYPFSLLLRQFQPQKDTGYPPLARVFFNMPLSQRYAEFAPLFVPEQSDAAIRWGGLDVEPFYIPQQQGQFPFGFDMWHTGDSLLCVVKYNADAFDAETIQRMGEHYRTILHGIAAQPKEPISRLPLLTDDDRRQMLVEWNDTAADYPRDKCFHQLFEERAARTPDAVAVVDGPRSLTYHELNAQANQLAAYLHELGVGPETPVGVCLERSIETLVSLLAIFKAGGTYLPLEPTVPTERMRFMLDDAAVRVVLTNGDCSANLPTEPARVVDLDAASKSIAGQPSSNLPPRVAPHHLAYIIYTSGSTGLPKGAMVTHQGMMNHLYAKIRDLDLTAHDRIAQTAPQSFDISIWQFLNALVVGGSVQIVDRDTVRTPTQLLELVEQEQISILEVVPSLFRALLDELAAQGKARPRFANLRWLLLTGETLPPALCNDWFPLYPMIPLMNAFGPTECSDDVTHHAIRNPLPKDATTVPIGRAVANTQLYVLDAQMQPTAIGVAGELYVGGDGVGRGYVNDARRTAAAFVPSPFATKPGSRLYKTGDLCRWQTDGTLDFLGRIDHQVKIRGHRIELGEIESVLTAHPQVREAMVLARDEERGEKRLVGYVVPFGGDNGQPLSLSAGQLRDYLSQSLPDYMAPSAFVFLDALPLTPNGKVDRKALPAPEGREELGQQYVPPRTPLQQQLCDLWQHVLRVERVGIADNFFELGGHSLLAVQLIAQLQHALDRQLPLAVLFQNPTVEKLASIIAGDKLGEMSQTVVPIQPQGAKPPLFFVPGDSGTVFYLRGLASHLGPEQPLYGLQSPGLDGKTPPLKTVEELAAHFVKEIRDVQPDGPYFLAGHSFGGGVALEMAQQLQRSGHRVGLVAVIDAIAPLPGRQFLPDELTADDANWSMAVTDVLAQFFGVELDFTYEELKALSFEQQLESVLEWMKRTGLQPPSADTTPIRGLIEVIRSNASARYCCPPETGLPTRIAQFIASHSEPTERSQPRPGCGWSAYSDEPIETHEIPGDHRSMMVEPNVAVLAERIEFQLTQVQTSMISQQVGVESF